MPNATTEMIGDRCSRSATIHAPKVMTNWKMMAERVPAKSGAPTCRLSLANTMPTSAPPGTATSSIGSELVIGRCAEPAADTATPNTSSATASLSRLSPLMTDSVRRGMRNCCITAAAATASGGATMAPSVMAAASGRPANAQPAHATAAVVSSTATSTSETSGSQLRRSSRGAVSKAESSSAGAMKSASARCGSRLMCGTQGIAPSATPASASIDG
jgi:hypothetical protein